MKFSSKFVVAPLLAAGLLSSSAVPAFSATAAGDYAVHGIGAQDCAVLTQASFKSNPANVAVLASWIMGFVTASNASTRGVFDRTPIQSPIVLTSVVAGVCSKQPKLKIDSAVASVLAFFGPAASVAISAPAEFRNDKYSIVLRAEVAQKVQAALKQKNFYKGPADGKNSPELIAALRAYQKSEKLTETGIPDVDTIIHLIINTK